MEEMIKCSHCQKEVEKSKAITNKIFYRDREMKWDSWKKRYISKAVVKSRIMFFCSNKCGSHDHHIISIRNNPNVIAGMINYNKFIKTFPLIQFDLSGKFMKEFKNGKEASDATGVCHRNILQVATKEEYKPGLTRKQAGGFIWELK